MAPIAGCYLELGQNCSGGPGLCVSVGKRYLALPKARSRRTQVSPRGAALCCAVRMGTGPGELPFTQANMCFVAAPV